MNKMARLIRKSRKFIFKKIDNLKIITLLTLTLLLIITTSAIAGYSPPPDQEPPSDQSKSSGIRGCPAITVLAPKTHVGQTISTHPSFAWFISNAEQQDSRFSPSVKFRIAEFVANGQLKSLATPVELQIVPGIMQLSLEQLTLNVDRKYLWQISVRCPDGSVVQRAEFKVVEMPSTLEQNLATADDSTGRADRYASAGVWYDAIAEALKVAQNGKLGRVGSNLVQSLARVEEKQASEKLTRLEEIKQQVARLKQIARSEA